METLPALGLVPSEQDWDHCSDLITVVLGSDAPHVHQPCRVPAHGVPVREHDLDGGSKQQWCDSNSGV